MSGEIDIGKVDYHFEIQDRHVGSPPPECHYPLIKRIHMAFRVLRYGCPDMWTVKCARCPKRPVKNIGIAGISIHDAIARGLVTKEQAMQMIKEEEKKNGDNQE